MRSSSGRPAAAASRSDCRPAQAMTRPLRNSPAAVSRIVSFEACPNALDPRSEDDFAAPLPYVLGESRGDPPVVHDPCRGHPDRPEARRVRLPLPNPFRPHLLEPGDAVGAPSLEERVEGAQVALRDCHDELPVDSVGDAVGVAEAQEAPAALEAEAGLERARFVVDPGVDDAAVVAGLVARDHGFLLQDREPQVRSTLQELARHRQADDPASDDDAVEGVAIGPRRGQGCVTVTLLKTLVQRTAFAWLVTARPTETFEAIAMVVVSTSVQEIPSGETYPVSVFPARTRRTQ